jgi:FAD/FMN-containing dehydrogenase
VTAPTDTAVRTDDVVTALRSAMRGAVDDSSRRRAEYSTDASNYRVVPQVVAFPQDPDDVLAALSVTRELGVPLTARGGGTSVAGNAVGTGVVLDFSRHVNRILSIDPEARTARIEPGVVMAALQKAAAPHGLRFGPDPSTQARATLGGMIGNTRAAPGRSRTGGPPTTCSSSTWSTARAAGSRPVAARSTGCRGSTRS